MNNLFSSWLTAFFIVLTIGLSAQHSPMIPCDTYGELAAPMIERLKQNQKALRQNPVQFRETVYIPIKFHLVARSNGTGRVNENQVLNQLCALNDDYRDLDIQFYIKDGFNYINNTTVYEDQGTAQNGIMPLFKDSKAINVWIVNDIPSSQIEGGQTLGFYSTTKDWLVMRANQVNANNTTLAHEMGHFFSLPHPFNGWDFTPWDASEHGNPTQSTSPQGVPTEKMDGSNCASAGDYICDTRPDYNFFDQISSCHYTGPALDPDSVRVDPDEKLFMGYFNGCNIDDYYFTEEQGQIMLMDYSSRARNYLRSDYVPNTEVVEGSSELIYPVSITTENYNAINFEWTAVDNADIYLLEIDRAPSFNISPIRILVYGTSKVVTELEANKTYFWRVRPFNETSACNTGALSKNFKTGLLSSVQQLDAVTELSIIPNPNRGAAEITLRFDVERAFEGQVTLIASNGQGIVYNSERSFSTGESTISIPVKQLASGVYFLRITGENSVLSRKVVITP